MEEEIERDLKKKQANIAIEKPVVKEILRLVILRIKREKMAPYQSHLALM